MKDKGEKIKITKICPKCGKDTFIESVFGSLCANEACFYDPKQPTSDEYERMYDGLNPKDL